jgi:tol-pal system protein YbgF
MKMSRFPRWLACALVVAAALPAHAQRREYVQLQTQIQVLQDSMARMQQGFDERMGVMRSLVEQNTDSMNKISAAVQGLERILAQQAGDTAGRVEEVSLQVQALYDSVEELKARTARITRQLEEMQAAREVLPADGSPSPPQAGEAPPANLLYDDALRDYNAGKYELAMQEFMDYLRFYPNTDLAGNAQFYIADIHYRQSNFKQAIADYDKVLEQYPGGNKVAAAHLKKGFALLELNQREAGIRELNSLIARYPRSIEANQARERLRRIGAVPATSQAAPRPAPRRNTTP